ncbi:unnamed protein product, partial [Rotaria sp. Silwood1]
MESKYFTLLHDYDEMALALECYLQMDIDLFYMKTCSFNGAQNDTFDKCLFNNDQHINIRYSLLPCRQ